MPLRQLLVKLNLTFGSSPEKAACPGVSIMLMRQPFHTSGAFALERDIV